MFGIFLPIWMRLKIGYIGEDKENNYKFSENHVREIY
jgi:hypothetical protein